MDISAYMSLLQSQGITVDRAVTPPSEVSQKVLKDLSEQSSSFKAALMDSVSTNASEATSQPVTWNGPAGGGTFAGKDGLQPGPARLNLTRDRRSEDGSSDTPLMQEFLTSAADLRRRYATHMNLTATIETMSTASKRSMQNFDMLIRGQ